jgi:tetratricopeptide (TPR) repeat protein
LAEWYVRNGQSLATANSHLQAYLKEYPEDTGALITLARCRRAQGEPDAARQSMVQVVQKQPDQTNAWLLLAILESDLDQPEKALEALTRLETCPPLEDAEEIQTKLQLQANVFRRLNRAIEAETFESALKKHKEVMLELTRSLEDAAKGSTDLTLRRKIGLLYVEAGLEKGARAWLGPILAKNPDDKEVHQALLKHYESRKDAAAKELADLARRRIAELSR